MNPTNRIVINTLVQYFKAIVNTLLALYTTRIVLDVLTVSDFGIYSVIAGFIVMMGFITNALVITTQRYLSYYQGRGDATLLKKYFANSLAIHLCLGAMLLIVLGVIKDNVVYDILRLPAERLHVAGKVYVISVLMMVLTILTTPFKALFISHENFVFLSFVDILDAVVKLAIALCLHWITYDKLLAYALLMLFITSMNFVITMVYAKLRYEECVVVRIAGKLERGIMRQLVAFAGWTTFGMGVVAGRVQGTAVILNHFLGTVVNAAYGLAFQIYGAIAVLVTSIINAINPQIMQAAGNHDKDRMIQLSLAECKYTVMLLSVFIIPVIVEMPRILSFWLVEVPQYTVLCCRAILIAFIFDQMSVGLQASVQALGNIRTYTLLVYMPKLLYIPLIWLMLDNGWGIMPVMTIYVATEALVAFIRIPYMNKREGLGYGQYFVEVARPLLPLILTSVSASLLVCWMCDFELRFLLTGILSVALDIPALWFFVLKDGEREYVINLLRRHVKR
ncbi:MAG: MATE family efflux transporter [Prevotella sp.]|nr:MATE family efflux transporter [Prevotella sp.]